MLFALGALGELRCVEAETGKLVWKHAIVAEAGAATPTYGFSASPLITGEKLVVLSGAGRGKSVLCYHKATGKLLWSALDDVTGYASPALLTLSGQPQIVVCCETRTIGLNPEDGTVLWSHPWRVLNNQLPIAQPVQLATNRFLLSAGYFTGSEAVEIVRSNSNFTAQTVWKSKSLKNKFTSSVVSGGYIYGLDEDILTCLDANTGERKWKGGHYGYGQLVLANSHLIILTGEGELALVKATPDKHDEVARFPALSGKTWNHPALAEGKLLVRNGAEMACFSLGTEAVP
jgi:outer membrane protein assembly factor BamB